MLISFIFIATCFYCFCPLCLTIKLNIDTVTSLVSGHHRELEKVSVSRAARLRELFPYCDTSNTSLDSCSCQTNGQHAPLRANGDLTKPTPLFCCSVKGHRFEQFKDKFHCQESITWGVRLRESLDKRKIQLVSAFVYGECPLTGMSKYRV